MCLGREIPVRVKIPADLSAEGVAISKWKLIDACIADIVSALQTAGIDMRGSCCGHGKTLGDIQLQDGRVLIPLDSVKGNQWMAANYEERIKLLLDWL